MKYLVLLTLATAAISLSFFVHDRIKESRIARQRLQEGFAALQAEGDARDISLGARNDALERQLERKIWNSPRLLRRRKQELATSLSEDVKRQQEQQKNGASDEPDHLSIALEQASIARIDERLKALTHSNP